MFVFVALLTIAFSSIDDCIKWWLARVLARETRRPWDECLAAVKGISVQELHRRWLEKAICVVIGVAVAMFLLAKAQ